MRRGRRSRRGEKGEGLRSLCTRVWLQMCLVKKNFRVDPNRTLRSPRITTHQVPLTQSLITQMTYISRSFGMVHSSFERPDNVGTNIHYKARSHVGEGKQYICVEERETTARVCQRYLLRL